MVSLLDYARELAEAMDAAGLDARIVSDPDRGAGVVVDAPDLDDGGRSMRSGCQDLAHADVECVITVIGPGWGSGQIETWLEDASLAWQAVPPPWHPTDGRRDATPDAPMYRITVRR